MYEAVLTLHSLLRWLVVLGVAFVLVRALVARFSTSAWKGSDTALMRATTVMFDVQLVLGLALLVYLSPIAAAAFRDFGAAMKDETLRFFSVEHTTLMLAALAFAHVGSARVKRAQQAELQAKRATLWFALTAICLAFGVPWWRGWL